MSLQKIKLNTGDLFPAIGLGTWKIDRDLTAETVFEAARIGYRHFDCACDYGNEQEVGAGLKKIVEDGICQRDDLWVTSKLWNTYHAKDHVRPAVERTLSDLGLESLDLYLVHFPVPTQYVPFEKRYPPGWVYDPDADEPCMHPIAIPYQETWRAMEELVQAGLVRNIGVSNLGCAALRDLLSYAKIRPSVNQVELHPYLTQNVLMRYCKEEQIAVTGFSPLGAPSYVPLGMAEESDSVMKEPVVSRIAETHQKTVAQIVLRWAVQRGTSIVPKSSHFGRLAENIDLFQFELSHDEMTAISQLNRNQRFNDPGVFCENAFGTFFPIFE